MGAITNAWRWSTKNVARSIRVRSWRRWPAAGSSTGRPQTVKNTDSSSARRHGAYFPDNHKCPPCGPLPGSAPLSRARAPGSESPRHPHTTALSGHCADAGRAPDGTVATANIGVLNWEESATNRSLLSSATGVNREVKVAQDSAWLLLSRSREVWGSQKRDLRRSAGVSRLPWTFLHFPRLTQRARRRKPKVIRYCAR